MSETRKTYTITFTKGLDKASSPFEADPARALDELNYVYRDGKVQKRHGYSELLNIKETYYSKVAFDGKPTGTFAVNSHEWNGIWRFKGEDGLFHLIAHVGKLLYEISETNGKWSATPITANSSTTIHDGNLYVSCYEFESYKSVAVIGDNSLYFFGGNQFMHLRYKTGSVRTFLPVANGEDTYVPTTTISITYENAITSGRQSYDQVNLLHDFRKNTLLSGVGYPSDTNIVTEHFEYTLDAPIISHNRAVDMASFAITLKERAVE